MHCAHCIALFVFAVPTARNLRLVVCTLSDSLHVYVVVIVACLHDHVRTYLHLQVMSVPDLKRAKGGLGRKKWLAEKPASPANSPTVAPSYSPITVSSRASSAATHPSSTSYSAGQGTSSSASTPAACPPAAESPSAASLGLLNAAQIARCHALQGVRKATLVDLDRRRSGRNAAHFVADYASSAPSYTPAGSAASTPFSVRSLTSASPRLSSVASSRNTTPRASSTRSGFGSPRASNC